MSDQAPGGAPYGTGPPPSGTSPDPLVPFSFSDWLDKIVGVVRRSWKPLLAVAALTYLPVMLLSGLLQWHSRRAITPPVPTAGDIAETLLLGVLLPLAGSLLMGALSAVGQVAAVFVVVRDAAGRPYAPGQVVAFTLSRTPATLAWALLAGLLVVLGFLVLVLPGIYLAVVFGGALYGVVAVERAGIGRAFTLVNPRFFPVLGRLALYALVSGGASAVVLAVTTPLGGGEVVLATLLAGVALLPLAIVGPAVLTVTYAENRFHEHHAVHTPVLADEIDRP